MRRWGCAWTIWGGAFAMGTCGGFRWHGIRARWPRFASLQGRPVHLLLSLQGARNSPRGERPTNGFANARKFAPRLGGTHGDFLCVDGGLSLRWQAGSRSGVGSSPRTTASWSQARQTHRAAHRMLLDTTSVASVFDPTHRQHMRHPATSAPGPGSPPPTSAPGLGSPLPHLLRDRARPRPHLHRDCLSASIPSCGSVAPGATCMACHTGRVAPARDAGAR